MLSPRLLGALALTLLVSFPARSQSNGISGLDAKLHDLGGIAAAGRSGTYPNGQNGIGAATTVCNVGTVQVDWFAAMSPSHPFIATLVARESGGRMVQISDRSYIKHGFTSTNTNQTSCGVCQNPSTGTKLGLFCTDTYSATLNANSYYLAPADEIDPWLGTWTAVGSHFDRGEPDVGPPANTDGIRSLTSAMVTAMGPIAHRMKVYDQDLVVPGAKLFYQGLYVIKGEFDDKRDNNLGSREFTAAWDTGTSKFLFTLQGTKQEGSVLTRWTGASVSSAPNGTDDGRFYIAVKVTGPVAGIYHYEYAIQNRDNKRGGKALHLPLCSAAQVTNIGFRDLDQNTSNDWTFARQGNELVFATASSPLLWNSIYNVWFDSDAAPAAASALIDQYAAGAGAASVSIATQAPMELNNQWLGDGCGAPAPVLFATGTPARALLGNATFGLQVNSVAPGAACVMLLSGYPGSSPVGSGCFAYVEIAQQILVLPITANASGQCSFPLPVPGQSALEGTALATQAIELQAGGAWYGQLDFSNGMKVRIGNALPGCP